MSPCVSMKATVCGSKASWSLQLDLGTCLQTSSASSISVAWSSNWRVAVWLSCLSCKEETKREPFPRRMWYWSKALILYLRPALLRAPFCVYFLSTGRSCLLAVSNISSPSAKGCECTNIRASEDSKIIINCYHHRLFSYKIQRNSCRIVCPPSEKCFVLRRCQFSVMQGLRIHTSFSSLQKL